MNEFFVHLTNKTILNPVLPKRIHLLGHWKLAVKEIYLRKTLTIPFDIKYGIWGENFTNSHKKFIIKKGNYTIKNIVEIINKNLKSISDERIKTHPKLFYKKGHFSAAQGKDNDDLEINISVDDNMRMVLGFRYYDIFEDMCVLNTYNSWEGTVETQVAKFESRITSDIYMKLICDIINPVIVDGKMQAILKTVFLNSKKGFARFNYNLPEYHSVLVKEFDRITLKILDSMDNELDFDDFEIYVVLHFRKDEL